MNEEEAAAEDQQQDLGYFSILNLNFFATDEDIKRQSPSEFHCSPFFFNFP